MRHLPRQAQHNTHHAPSQHKWRIPLAPNVAGRVTSLLDASVCAEERWGRRWWVYRGAAGEVLLAGRWRWWLVWRRGAELHRLWLVNEFVERV